MGRVHSKMGMGRSLCRRGLRLRGAVHKQVRAYTETHRRFEEMDVQRLLYPISVIRGWTDFIVPLKISSG